VSIYRGTYYSASKCTGAARPGAKALMSWYLGAYGDRGAANLGIYVCKSLGSGVSIHGDGRACDLGTAPYNRPGGNWPAWGWALANALVANSNELGIQLVIFNGKVWSCRYPDSGFRKYTGTDPHDGHLHVELIPSAAANLTADKIQTVLSGGTITLMGGDMIGLKRGDEGQEVLALQYVLADAGFDPGEKDKVYGGKVAAAVLACRKSLGSSAKDGDEITGTAYAQILRALIKKQATGVKGDRGPAGPAGPAGKNGKDGTLKLPAAVAITGQVTALGAGA
jgi:hypothetical protein